MSVIPLTLFFSLLLAGTFVLLFAREQRRRHLTSPERDSLLPLADETPQVAPSADPAGPGEPDHDHGDEHAPDHNHHADGDPRADHASRGRCGCKDGLRPPCVGCLKRPAVPASP